MWVELWLVGLQTGRLPGACLLPGSLCSLQPLYPSDHKPIISFGKKAEEQIWTSSPWALFGSWIRYLVRFCCFSFSLFGQCTMGNKKIYQVENKRRKVWKRICSLSLALGFAFPFSTANQTRQHPHHTGLLFQATSPLLLKVGSISITDPS